MNIQTGREFPFINPQDDPSLYPEPPCGMRWGLYGDLEQVGGGRCSLCGAEGVTKVTCPQNPTAKNPKPDKHNTPGEAAPKKEIESPTPLPAQAAKPAQAAEPAQAVTQVEPKKQSPPKQVQRARINCDNGNGGKVVFTGSPMLAHEVKSIDTFDPVGWYASEKYDGFRAVWNGKQFLSRTGNEFVVPEWFSALMPPSVSLDGEFWMGRCKFESCGLFRRAIPDEAEWIANQPKYLVYDIHMESDLPFEQRMEKLKALVDERCQCMVQLQLPRQIIDIECPLVFAPQHRVTDKPSLMKYYKDLVEAGAEGVMLRQPGSRYEQKRSYTLMKVKPEFDSECKIVGYKDGKGKYAGQLGSFQCEWHSPSVNKTVKFYISGMDDSIRENYQQTHPIGTKITFTFKGVTKNGVPRNPNYMRLFNRP